MRFIRTEICFNVWVREELTVSEKNILRWLLAETFEPHKLKDDSILNTHETVVEVGPRLAVESPFSSNAVNICHKCGLTKVTRLERSTRFGVSQALSEEEKTRFLEPFFDRMTQEVYATPPADVLVVAQPAPMATVALLEEGLPALQQVNKELQLAMDSQDLAMWHDLFVGHLKRNPTDVELFQIGQANSEHCRHGYWGGIHVIDWVEVPESLMDLVKATWQANPRGSVIAFADNSSAIEGHRCLHLIIKGSRYSIERGVLLHPTLTAETHNHPTGKSPYHGAGTGDGGRKRDGQQVGCGGYLICGGAGYTTANLRIPGYTMPWEEGSWEHPSHLASPLTIMIQASNGASDYGNCFGEPIVYGFARTAEVQLPTERRAWFKPIMYSVGSGSVRDEHVKKSEPEAGMLIVLLGGPSYRIGVGGGSASSLVAGAGSEELDFASVQRGNPEMGNCVNRVVKACIDMGEDNPIEVAHDLGAGGTANALPEAANPAGARINLRAIPSADPTLSKLELWGNESQERNVVLIRPERREELEAICKRENCPMAVVGEITGDGELTVYDESDGTTPVQLPLEKILGKLPRKRFEHMRIPLELEPLSLPENLTVSDALPRVLRLLSVASKHWLTNKVDRSVTGLIAQQQCVGPHHIPLADFAVRADSHFGVTGAAMSLGEQPMKGLINPAAMARLAVAEALLNMSGALIDDPDQIKCSGNWMWAAKEPGEGPRIIDASIAARDIMIELKMAIDGGKDSLTMAAKVKNPQGDEEIVKAPGQFVVAAYASMSDITRKVTPDLKQEGNTLLWIDLGFRKGRLGGSALAQVFNQVGNESPDVDNVPALRETFLAVQDLIRQNLVKSIHDISDGGLIVTLLEMAFAGNKGFNVSIANLSNSLATFFAEEPGVVLEVHPHDLPAVRSRLILLPVTEIGSVGYEDGQISIVHYDTLLLREPMFQLRALWQETGNRLERLQVEPECAKLQENCSTRGATPQYRLTFTPEPTVLASEGAKPTVALVREEGTNGDREMAAALMLAGFDVRDVPMYDLIQGTVSLDEFRGVVFPGGFSFGDVLDSGKGWAGVIRFNSKVKYQFERFRDRPDTFSLGVCNGAQLSCLLSWVPGYAMPETMQPRFLGNLSERFESRFSTVKIMESSSIMLRGMEGSILGVWVAHREGRFHSPDQGCMRMIMSNGNAPIRYVNMDGIPTSMYPDNPNGSPRGVAALCSTDGRHLAMMPHPERTVLTWQWPWMPEEWRDMKVSPWLRMFQNAYTWCTTT